MVPTHARQKPIGSMVKGSSNGLNGALHCMLAVATTLRCSPRKCRVGNRAAVLYPTTADPATGEGGVGPPPAHHIRKGGYGLTGLWISLLFDGCVNSLDVGGTISCLEYHRMVVLIEGYCCLCCVCYCVGMFDRRVRVALMVAGCASFVLAFLACLIFLFWGQEPLAATAWWSNSVLGVACVALLVKPSR